MRSTPAKDQKMRAQLQAAVDAIAGGSADKFGREIGYANGGYIREVLSGKKPMRGALIERIAAKPALADFFVTDGVSTFAIEVKAPAATSAVLSLDQAVAFLADYIGSLDEYGRDAAAPVLARLAAKPGEAARASEMLARLGGKAPALRGDVLPKWSDEAVEVAEAIDQLPTQEDRRRANTRALSAIGNMPLTGEPDTNEQHEAAAPPSAVAEAKPSRSRARNR